MEARIVSDNTRAKHTMTARLRTAERTDSGRIPNAARHSRRELTTFTVCQREERGCPRSRMTQKRLSSVLATAMTSKDVLLAFSGRWVGKRVHVLRRPSVCVDVLRPAIRVGELGMSVSQENGHRYRGAVHH
jgi:hypothetical protein